VGRIVDGSDGDDGASGLLPCSVGHPADQSPNLPDIADLEKFLCLAGTEPAIGPVTPKEETTLDCDLGHEATVKNEPMLDFDDCFSELFPDLTMAESGIINL